jgi:hypothetical protein
MLDAPLADVFSDGHAKVLMELAREMDRMHSSDARQGSQTRRF